MWDNKIFFGKLNILLKEKGWSLCELSIQAGLSSGMIYRWRNQNCVPSMDSLQKVSRALGVPIEYFINGEQINGTRNKIELLNSLAKKLTDEQLDAVIDVAKILLRSKE